MQKLIIKGRRELSGKISISGSKNATLPILAASILTRQSIIKNVPLVKDIFTMLELLKFIGVKVKIQNKNKIINIGSAGGMTRLSTGYTFLNIQEHSKYIVKNIDNIDEAKIFNLGKKYQFLDKVFLRVLEKHPEKMPKIFFNMFKTSSNTIIKFLSNKSNIIEDINIISKMPKLIFLKALFN